MAKLVHGDFAYFYKKSGYMFFTKQMNEMGGFVVDIE